MSSEMNSSMYSRRLGAPGGTPESEFSNFECFQNYTAPEVFVQGLAGIVNQGDVEMMIRAQKQMLQRFEKTNEMLLNCNALSAGRLKVAGEDFKKHTKLLNDMKKDLDYIFKKIRLIRTKINHQYPDAFAEVQPQRCSFAEECEDDDDVARAQTKTTFEAAAGAAPSAAASAPSSAATLAPAATVGIVGTTGEASTTKSTVVIAINAESKVDHKSKESDVIVKTDKKQIERKCLRKSIDETATSVVYMQMKHSPDNGQSSGELDNRRSIGSAKSQTSTDNSNDSSEDGTSDTA